MKTDNTFVKLYRSLLNWEWYTDVNTTKLFLHLLLVANRFPSEWRGIKVNQGQRLTSLSKLAKETGLSVQQTRTAISHLKLTGEITSESTNGYTLITVENYTKYQGGGFEPTSEPTNDSTGESTSDQHASQQQIKKEKKVKKVKEYIYSREIEEIVGYLNHRCGTNYRPTTKETRRLITARLNENYKVEDFYKVIDVKADEWENHPKMRDFLRPQTLFGSKFESYLNQRPTTGNPFADAVMRGEFRE